MRWITTCLAVVTFISWPRKATAEEATPSPQVQSPDMTPEHSSTEAEEETPTSNGGIPGTLVAGFELGVIIPQIMSNLVSHVSLGLELGYRLPFLGQRFELMLSAGWAPPYRGFTDGEYQAEVRQQELVFGLGPRVRFAAVGNRFNGSLALGPRVYLLRSESDGSANGQSFAEFHEKSTQIGVFAEASFELNLGQGALFVDADFGWAPLPHTITGDVSTGNLTVTFGYRFFIL